MLILYSYILDLLLGDPCWFPHPVRIIGKIINLLDNLLRRKQKKWIERIKGMLMFFIVVGMVGWCVSALIEYAGRLHVLLGKTVWVFLAYTTLATRDLYKHGKAVLNKLNHNDLKSARYKLSLIVGRDTKMLSKNKIITATIESISENTADGIIAPMFYLFLGGPVFAMIYKAVNTLDSMVGYKNEKYIHFGWFSAKMDDVMNYIPARITGILILSVAFITGKSTKDSFRIMLRDGKKHSSPNSAISEAAMAGALGIQIAGPCVYQGKRFEHPYLGDALKTVKPEMIQESLVISVLTSLLMITTGILAQWAL